MSSRDQHTGDGAINTEEHLGEGGVNRKAVGLFARDALGTGAFELSALSTASGAVLSTTPASISANVNVANVTLNPGPNHIGSVTIFGDIAVTAEAGMTTLFPGPNKIGIVTVGNTVTVTAASLDNIETAVEAIQAGQLPDSHNVTVDNSSIAVTGTFFPALVSLASGTEVRSLTTVLNWPTTLVSLASGTEVRSLTTLLNQPALVAGTAQIGSVTVSNQITGFATETKQDTANTSLNNIDQNTNGIETLLLGIASYTDGIEDALAAIDANQLPDGHNVAFSGLISLASGTEVRVRPVSNVTLNASNAFIGLVTVGNNPNVTVSNLLSLASGTEVRSLATILNFPATVAVTQSGTWDEIGINDSGNSITIDGNVGITGLISLASGTNVLTSFSGLISLASGTEVRSLTTVLNWPTSLTSLASGTEVRSLTTILPRTDYIGLVSVSGNVAVSNFPATVAVTQSGTWDEVGINDSGNSITVDGALGLTGLVSLASGTEVRSLTTILNPDIRSVLSFPTINVVTQAITVESGMVTIFPGPNQIGSVTVSNSVAVTNAGLTELASAIDTELQVDVVGALPAGTNNIGDVDVLSLPAIPTGANYIGLVTASIVGTVNTGMTTLFPGPNFIGLVTVGNVVSVAQSGTWDEVGINDSGNSITIDGNVGVTGLLSLASGTEVRSLATVLNFPATYAVTQSGTWDEVGINDSGNSITVDGSVGVTGLLSLASGTEVRSLATLLNQPALIASSAFIGLTTTVNGAGTAQIGSVTVSNFTAPNLGNVTLNASSAHIGSVSIFGTINSTPGMTTIFPGPNYIGLVTTSLGRSITTVFSGYISASGYSTVFTPPSGQKWFMHNLMINTKGNADGFVGSPTVPKWTWTSLATSGGLGMTFDSPGIAADAINLAFTVRQFSLVTITYNATIHFE